MKKTVIIITVFLCATVLFAGKNSFNLSLVPYGVQISTSSIDGQEPVKSNYGIGATLVYQRYLHKGLFVEGGLGWNTFILPRQPKGFTNLIYYGGFGYKLDFGKVFSLTNHVAIAGDTLLYDQAGSATVTFVTGIGCDFAFNQYMSMTAGCDATFGLAKEEGYSNYVNYRILPKLGCTVSF